MTTPQISLKPCPFCGSQFDVDQPQFNDSDYADQRFHYLNGTCDGCDCSMQVSISEEEGRALTTIEIRETLERMLVAKWNRRTDTARELRDALNELCDAVNCATSSGYTNYSRYVKDAHRAALAALARPEPVADSPAAVANPDEGRLDWLEKRDKIPTKDIYGRDYTVGFAQTYCTRKAIDAARSSELGEGK